MKSAFAWPWGLGAENILQMIFREAFQIVPGQPSRCGEQDAVQDDERGEAEVKPRLRKRALLLRCCGGHSRARSG